MLNIMLVFLLFSLYFILVNIVNFFYRLRFVKLRKNVDKTKKLSFFIKLKNSDNIEKYLESILSQEHQNIEIILANNNLSDKNLKIIEELQAKFSKKITRIFNYTNDIPTFVLFDKMTERAVGDYFLFLTQNFDINKKTLNFVDSALKKYNFIYGFEKTYLKNFWAFLLYPIHFFPTSFLSFIFFVKKTIFQSSNIFICKREIYENLKKNIGAIVDDKSIIKEVFKKGNTVVFLNLHRYFSIKKKESFEKSFLDAKEKYRIYFNNYFIVFMSFLCTFVLISSLFTLIYNYFYTNYMLTLMNFLIIILQIFNYFLMLLFERKNLGSLFLYPFSLLISLFLCFKILFRRG